MAQRPPAAPPLLVRTVRDTIRLESGNEYVIGRNEQAQIPLVDARVSWEHAVIRAEGPVWVLEDRGSRNGTFLGSERVGRLEISGPYVVHFGHPEDGPVLRFELTAPEPPQQAYSGPGAGQYPGPGGPGPGGQPGQYPGPGQYAGPGGQPGQYPGSGGYPGPGGQPGQYPGPNGGQYAAPNGYAGPGGQPGQYPGPNGGQYPAPGMGMGMGMGGQSPAPMDTTFLPGVLRDPTTRVRLQSKVMRIGRRPDNDIVVADLGVSKQHAELRQSATGTYQIIDLGSHNGTFVNGTRVNEATLTENDIIAIGHATFRLVGGELIEYVDDGRATFEAHELRVVVGDGGKQKVLLEGITFPLESRSMMAVIGPAGAGKSTLLNALTGKRPATTGSVFYDFRDLYENYDELRQRIGLVPQESVTHDQLTAKSALGYQAELRFPSDITEAERDHRVGEVLDELSMARHADTRIDRLSGGQKKRVNIGMELLTRPSLLFLDEPTSPLDPHLKREMFAQMRKMADKNADKGQSVIVITHDVESKLIDQCDRLIVLQPGGKMAYFGAPADGLRYFGANDWADVFQSFSDEPERDFAAEFRNSPEFQRNVANPLSVRHQRLDAGRPEGEEAARPKQRSSVDQVFTMARRYRRVMLADRGFVITTLLMPILLGGLVRVSSSKFGLADSPGQSGLNTAAITMLMILVMSSVLSGTALSIREFIKEREIFERERMAGLSATAYLFSKVIVLSMISVMQTLLIVLVGLTGVKAPSKGAFIPGPPIIEIFIALAVLAVASMLIGLAISTLVTKSDQTMPILVGVTMVQVALSGGLFPLGGSKVLAIISSIAPARWGLGAVASTIDLNKIQSSARSGPNPQPFDGLWIHSASHWLIAIVAMLLLGIIWLVIARLRLGTIGPRRRKHG